MFYVKINFLLPFCISTKLIINKILRKFKCPANRFWYQIMSWSICNIFKNRKDLASLFITFIIIILKIFFKINFYININLNFQISQLCDFRLLKH